MTRRREIWFERVWTTPSTWRPVHRNGWRTVFIMTGTFVALLVAAIILPLTDADPGWTIALMVACIVVAASFLWTVRGRVRG